MTPRNRPEEQEEKPGSKRRRSATSSAPVKRQFERKEETPRPRTRRPGIGDEWDEDWDDADLGDDLDDDLDDDLILDEDEELDELDGFEDDLL
ncbi:MAG: hypothetical protein R6X25_02655 [Candidatus Krumholzibacteriia bacterium]